MSICINSKAVLACDVLGEKRSIVSLDIGHDTQIGVELFEERLRPEICLMLDQEAWPRL